MPCDSCGDTPSKPVVTGYIPGTSTLAINHSECRGIGIDLLNMWLRLIVCARKNDLYSNISVTEQEISSAESLLSAWIRAKEIDPATCEYQEKLSLMQMIINKIVAFGRC